jgi:hypothetical protein
MMDLCSYMIEKCFNLLLFYSFPREKMKINGNNGSLYRNNAHEKWNYVYAFGKNSCFFYLEGVGVGGWVGVGVGGCGWVVGWVGG